MRRKSERNKGKSSPEKKVEKPTRKSTRRRGKRSPSTSPDRENSSDAAASRPDGDRETAVQAAPSTTRSSSRDLEKSKAPTTIATTATTMTTTTTTTTMTTTMTTTATSTATLTETETETTSSGKVTSTDTPIVADATAGEKPRQEEEQPQQEETTEAGSVWKVARADASPGEIQKLKLCRQRNMSETSDASSGRKRTSKWNEGGASGSALGGGEGITEEIDSADERLTVGSSSMTSVDCARAPTGEIASVVQVARDSSQEVSDSKEFPPEIATAELSDVKPNIDRADQGDRDDDHDDDDDGRDVSTTMLVVPSDIPRQTPDDDDGDDDDDDHDDDDDSDRKRRETVPEASERSFTPHVNDATAVPDKREEPKSPPRDPKEERSRNDDVDAPGTAAKSDSIDEPKANEKVATDNAEDSKGSSSSDDNDKKINDESREGKRNDTSEDNTDEDKDRAKKALPSRTTGGRRKHRDKYRDSSNSDSAESEDESERDSKMNKRDQPVDKIADGKQIARDNCKGDIRDKNEKRSDTPIFDNDTSDQPAVKVLENDKTKFNEENERNDIVVTANANAVQSQNNYKPAKVNLKRSFAARPSVETVDSKKDSTEVEANDLANQDKENHGSSDQTDAKSIPKKRRWGTILAPTDPTPAFTVSTDSLKVLVPGAKPLPINEVRLSKDDDEERDRRSQREKRYSVGEAGADHNKIREEGEKVKNAESKKDPKGDNHIGSRRKISIVKDTQHAKSPSPPAAIPTSILLIKNLVRPFTLNQIRELLSRTGTIVENGFWMDRIKSKCFVEYCNEDQAFETRQALHGISWPVSNPKKLQVEYATKDDMELARELSKDQPPSRKTEPLAANDGWQQDWARDERTNSTTKVTVVREWDLGKEDGQHFAKEKEREKKELDKKRRQRSRSPDHEAHLPAPARKFKKKEDDPPPAKLLDDLFRKTKATPCIYWLPLTNEQIVVKEEMRRQRVAEHARRLEEMRRAERNRDGRRRRSPRK